MPEQAEEDLLAFYRFPAQHWSKLRFTNPLERLNKEIGRRADVVAIFPNDRSLICLVSMLAIEANNDWLVTRCYMSRQSMEPLLEQQLHQPTEEEASELQAA